MRSRLVWALAVSLAGCGPEEGDAPAAAPNEPELGARQDIDPALLHELLGEAVRVDDDRVWADGLLVRLAFEPLIRQTGPVETQQVQGQGYQLSGITDGSPLWLLGLRDGDVLTGVDGQPIIGREHELRSIWQERPRLAELTYLRGTEARTLRLRIDSGSAWRSKGAPSDLLISPSRPPRPSREPELANDFATGLRCVKSDDVHLLGRCEVERETLGAVLEAPERISRQARVIPALRDGEMQGYKLYGIRPNSIPHLLGLKNGDLLLGINQNTLSEMDAATFAALSDATEFEISIERHGRRTTLELEIVDKLSGEADPMQ